MTSLAGLKKEVKKRKKEQNNIPKNIATVPQPEKRKVIDQQVSRFKTI